MLNGCLLASMFVCLEIVNNKLSSLHDWAMRNVTSSLGKIIRTAVRSIMRNPLLSLPETTLHKASPLFFMLAPP